MAGPRWLFACMVFGLAYTDNVTTTEPDAAAAAGFGLLIMFPEANWVTGMITALEISAFLCGMVTLLMLVSKKFWKSPLQLLVLCNSACITLTAFMRIMMMAVINNNTDLEGIFNGCKALKALEMLCLFMGGAFSGSIMICFYIIKRKCQDMKHKLDYRMVWVYLAVSVLEALALMCIMVLIFGDLYLATPTYCLVIGATLERDRIVLGTFTTLMILQFVFAVTFFLRGSFMAAKITDKSSNETVVMLARMNRMFRALSFSFTLCAIPSLGASLFSLLVGAYSETILNVIFVFLHFAALQGVVDLAVSWYFLFGPGTLAAAMKVKPAVQSQASQSQASKSRGLNGVLPPSIG